MPDTNGNIASANKTESLATYLYRHVLVAPSDLILFTDGSFTVLYHSEIAALRACYHYRNDKVVGAVAQTSSGWYFSRPYQGSQEVN
jgi:hypothetical protein